MIKLIIDSVDYSQYAEGIDKLDYLIKLSQDGTIERGATSILKATGKLYELIYNKFFLNPCSGRNELLKANLKIDCQGSIIDIPVELPAIGIDFCISKCEANIVFKSTKVENEAYNCLKSQTNYHLNNGFGEWIVNQKRNYKMVYCQDYTAMTYILLTSYTSIKLIVDLLMSIVNSINAVLDFLGFDKVNWNDPFNNLENAVIGCNHYHDVILLKDIFVYNLRLCGLEFQSSIFDDPIYKNTAIESGVSGEGFFIQNCQDSDTQFNEDNAENINVLQLAERLRSVFNAEYRIKKGKFVFERKDYFYNNLKTLLNVDAEYRNGTIDVCPNFEFNDLKLCAYWKIEYQNDFLDAMGNKMLREYNEIVEWNKGNERKDNKGECRIDAKFSPARFSNDSYIEGIFGAVLLANLRTDNGLGVFETGTCDFAHAQIITDGQLTNPKLIVIDPDKPVINCFKCNFVGATKRRVYGDNVKFKGSGNISIRRGIWDYNSPMKGQQLYDRFHYIDNPNSESARYIKLADFIWTPRNFCEAVNLILENELSLNVDSDLFGGSTPTQISINFNDCKIKFGGLNFKCKK